MKVSTMDGADIQQVINKRKGRRGNRFCWLFVPDNLSGFLCPENVNVYLKVYMERHIWD